MDGAGLARLMLTSEPKISSPDPTLCCDSTKFINFTSNSSSAEITKSDSFPHLLVDTSPLRFFTLHLSTEVIYIPDAMKRGSCIIIG